MSERFIIELPHEKAEQLRRIAKLTGDTVENLISKGLAPMPPNDSLDLQLERITTYSDVQLWSIVESPVLSASEKSAWDILLQRAKARKALAGDEAESKKFSELYNKRGLLRAKALAELLARSYDVHAYLDENAPEE